MKFIIAGIAILSGVGIPLVILYIVVASFQEVKEQNKQIIKNQHKTN